MESPIGIRTMQPGDVEHVVDILHYTFFRSGGDPLSEVLKFDVPRETKCFVDYVMPKALADGMSVVAVDKESGQIVGIGLCHHLNHGSPKEGELSRNNPDVTKMSIALSLLNKVGQPIDVCEKYQVSNCVYFQILAVKTEYRRLGIAKRLVLEAIKLARGNGIPLMVVIASSNYSKKVFDKLGFDILNELRYVDFMMDGKPFSTGKDMDVHEACYLCARRL